MIQKLEQEQIDSYITSKRQQRECSHGVSETLFIVSMFIQCYNNLATDEPLA